MAKAAEASSWSERVDVYFHGVCKDLDQLWYLVEFDPSPNEEDKEVIIKLKPVAKLPRYARGYFGNWTVYGNDIYYAGGFRFDGFVRGLLKHNIHESDPEAWIIENCEPPLRLTEPFVAADVANKKLYIVGGYTLCKPDNAPCGVVYDLVSKSWTCLDGPGAHISKLEDYNALYEASLVVKDSPDEEPMEIVFYKVWGGSMQFLNVAGGGKLSGDAVHDEFSLDRPMGTLPPGLLDCNDVDFHALCLVSDHMPAVVIDGTFYWFNLDMCLYGYDSNAKTWIKSQCLKEYFPKPYYDGDEQMPLLLGLRKNKMLVILHTSHEELTIASLVVKKTDNLHVSVETARSYCFDNHSYLLIDGGKAIISGGIVSSSAGNTSPDLINPPNPPSS